jgi:hypothetical protein
MPLDQRLSFCTRVGYDYINLATFDISDALRTEPRIAIVLTVICSADIEEDVVCAGSGNRYHDYGSIVVAGLPITAPGEKRATRMVEERLFGLAA